MIDKILSNPLLKKVLTRIFDATLDILVEEFLRIINRLKQETPS